MALQEGAKRPRGMRDFGPAEMKRRTTLLGRLDAVATRHGFARISTPNVEHLDLFEARSGANVVDELYAFADKGGRSLALRPELTAPVMRFVASELRQSPKPLRVSYFGPCYRYEEFKAGRWREFFQFGVELIGAPGPHGEAEVIALGVEQLADAGLEDWCLRLGHVGVLTDVLDGLSLPAELGTAWAACADAGWTRPVDEAAPEVPRALAMRLLDKADWAGLSGLFGVMGMDAGAVETVLRPLAELGEGDAEGALASAGVVLAAAGLEAPTLAELGTVVRSLGLVSAVPLDLRIDLSVARGLDYYTGVVFEAHCPELKSESQVLGGGTYRLLHLFGLEDMDPACGFGFGFDRVLMALEAQAARAGRDEVVPGERGGPTRVAVLPFRVDVEEVLPIVRRMRSAGYAVDIDLRQRNLGRGLKWADGSGAHVALIVGPQDLGQGTCTLKRLRDGEQREVAMQSLSLIATLSELAMRR